VTDLRDLMGFRPKHRALPISIASRAAVIYHDGRARGGSNQYEVRLPVLRTSA
jgi:hypothetical protein